MAADKAEDQIRSCERTMSDHDTGRAEESLWTLPQLRETVETIFRVGLVLFTVCYVIGLLILNSYLAWYGIFSLNILQVQYIMIGALWLFLVIFFYSVGLFAMQSIKIIPRSWKKGLILFPIVSVLSLILLPAGLMYVMVILSGYLLEFGELPLFVVIGILICTVATLSYIRGYIQNFLTAVTRQDSEDGDKPFRKWHGLYSALFQIVVLLGFISAYAFYVFPRLSSSLGGGQPQRVEFVASASHVDTLNSIGFHVSPNHRRFGPLELIFESSEFFLVAPSQEIVSEDNVNVKAIRIRKDLIDAAFYLGRKGKVVDERQGRGEGKAVRGELEGKRGR